ncbi:MAG TPA: pilus assembly protein N-terminal domain-containing protein [Candidatus Binataceae bacterium]|nr:pilus assembly protein N-terminal domain-containing protein [Candidatus Binataceae bacterium]
MAVSLNAGETYVIKGLSVGGTPAVHVINNPNALVVHGEAPGELVLLGASAGQWAIDVKTDEGEKVTYKVTVKAIAKPALEPGKAPVAMGASSPRSDSDKSAASTTTLDSGSGLVANPSSATPAASAPAAGSETAAVPPSGPAGLTAGAVSATAPAASTAAAPAPLPSSPASSTASAAAPAAASAPSAPMTVADNSIEASTGSSAPAAPPVAAAPAASVASPAAAPVVTADNSSPVIPSQAAGGAERLPAERFKTDPLAVPASPVETAASGTHYLPEDTVLMSSGSSHIFDFPRRIRRVSIADTEVADLQVINPYQLNLIGHKAGFTTLAVWDAQGRYEEREIRVDPYGRQQVLLNVIVAELNRGRLEQQGINWSAALPHQGISLVGITGGPATPYSPNSSLTSSTLIGAGTANQALVQTTATGTLPPQGQLIPMLLSQNVNYALAAGNGNVQAQTLFNFLENHALAKILAQPHLLANSGEKAEFLSGGEIPIVIAQALNTSVVFKQFGTSVIFVPTVVGRDTIELEVKPEVSEPDYAHGVSMFGFTIPAFVTRRAQTVVRLQNNQTLIIAGLILHTKTSQVNKTPYLGDMPFVGALFKGTSYSDQETDLVMSVTPQMVQPLPSNGTVALPTDRGPMSYQEIRTERLDQLDASRPRF